LEVSRKFNYKFVIEKQERGKNILREKNYEGGIIGFLCSLNVNLKELWEN